MARATMDARPSIYRPQWSLKKPDYEVSYWEIVASGAPPIQALIATTTLLRPEETMLLRMEFNPILLLRALAIMGIDSWTQRSSEKGLRIYLFKKPEDKQQQHL